jgi:hypothetical protein
VPAFQVGLPRKRDIRQGPALTSQERLQDFLKRAFPQRGRPRSLSLDPEGPINKRDHSILWKQVEETIRDAGYKGHGAIKKVLIDLITFDAKNRNVSVVKNLRYLPLLQKRYSDAEKRFRRFRKFR